MEEIFGVFKSPGSELLNIGGLVVRWYGLLIALAVVIGLNLSSRLADLKGLRKGLINDLLPIIVLASVIGARIYYVAFEWRKYQGIYFWSYIKVLGAKIPIPRFLEVWNGGIAIHGALIGGFIAIFIFCRLRNEPFWETIDVLVPSVILGQGIGRWGNFFNNEAFGLPTDLPWKLFIPFSFRPEAFLEKSFFHPTFLYESIWNIGIFLILIYLLKSSFKGRVKLPEGALTCIYLIGYSTGRLWIEGLRIDSLCIGAFPPFCQGGLRIAQLISILLITLGTLGLLWIYQKKKKMPNLTKIRKL